MPSYLDSVADSVASEMLNGSRQAATAEAAALSAEADALSAEADALSAEAVSPPSGLARDGSFQPSLVANGVPSPANGSGPKKSYAKSMASWKTASSSGGAAVGGFGAVEVSDARAETERLSEEVKRIVEEVVAESASTPIIEPEAMSVTIGGRVIYTTPGFASTSRSAASTAVQSSSVATESASPTITKKKGWGKGGASWKNNPSSKDGSGGGYLDNLKP